MERDQTHRLQCEYWIKSPVDCCSFINWGWICEVLCFRQQISRITRGVELFLVQNSYYSLCQAQKEWLFSEYITTEPKIFKHFSSKLLFVHFEITSFSLKPKPKCFLSPLFLNSMDMFLSKKNYWKGIPSTIIHIWYYNILAIIGEKHKLEKTKQKIINVKRGTIEKEHLLGGIC